MKTLIVDDNKDGLYLLETILNGIDYEVIKASNGAEALEKLDKEDFDLIISDILMPVMDGFQLCRNVKKDNKLKNIPFVFYTATFTEKKDEELSLKLGVDKFIRKPVKSAELIKIIKDLIRDIKEKKIKRKKPFLEEDEKEIFNMYSERLVSKLEKKRLALEEANVTLQESEEKFKELVDSIGDIFFAMDKDLRYIYWNKASEKLTGISAKNTIGKSIFEIFPDNEQTRSAEKVYQEVLKTHKSRTFINEYQIGDKKFVFEISAYPSMQGLSVFTKDITERKKAEDELKRHAGYAGIRAEIWKLAADKSLDENSLIQKLLDIIGPLLGVSRACYNIFKGKNPYKSVAYCIVEWCNKGVKPSLGTKLPVYVVSHFILDDFVEVRAETILSKINKKFHPIVKPLILQLQKTLDLEYAWVRSFKVDGKPEGVFTFDICKSSGQKPELTTETKHMVDELAGIVSNHIIHRRAVRQLADSERRLKILFENAPDGIYLHDLLGNFVDGNKAAEELTGYKKEELTGKNFMKLNILPVNQIPKAAANLAKNALFKGTGPDEFTLKRKDGTFSEVEISTFPVKIQRKTLVLGIARDIYERKKAEKELKRTSDFLENLINYAHALIIVWDPEFRITRFNHAFEHITGYKADKVINKELSMLFPEASKDESMINIKHTLNGEFWESVEIPILCKNGYVKIVLWNSANIYDNDNKTILATIAQGQNITERKIMEEELKTFNKLAVGREMKMIELKKEINELLKKSGKKPGYEIVE